MVGRISKLFSFSLTLLLALGSFSIAPAAAGKVKIFAYALNGTIYIESYFPNGAPAAGAKIEIFDSRNQKLASGITDKEGRYSLAVPKVDDLTITMDASMGNRASVVLKKDELKD